MGLFDIVRSKFQLPLDGANDLEYQSKDMPYGGCGTYEIRENGEVWLVNGELSSRRECELDDFRFYTMLYSDNDDGAWIEFRANVIDGIVTSIDLLHNCPWRDVPYGELPKGRPL